MAPGGPMPACTRSGRSRISSSTPTCRQHTLRRRVNDALPADIYIRRMEKAPHQFHARHDAEPRAATSIRSPAERRAFFKPYVWWIKEPLDVETDARARRRPFVGMQNFASFSGRRAGREIDASPGRPARDRTRTATSCSSGSLDSHFLWRMVRRIVGVLAAVGRGELTRGAGGRLPRGIVGSPGNAHRAGIGTVSRRCLLPRRRGPGPVRPVGATLSVSRCYQIRLKRYQSSA